MVASSSAVLGTLRELDFREPHPSRLVLSSPWGARLPSTGEPGMYIVTQGTAWIRTARDKRPVALQAGDVALLPHGSAHALSSDPSARTPPIAELFAEYGGGRGVDMVAGGGGAEAHLDTLCFRIGSVNAKQLFGAAPSLVVLNHESSNAWSSHVARALSALIACPDVDAAGDAPTKLSEILFGVALREMLSHSDSHSEADAESSLDSRSHSRRDRDAAVTVARVLIHADLAQSWTVELLARRVGVSKSSFHDRFARATGSSPMDYVSTARMRHASELLTSTNLSIQEIAEMVGYQSASSFAVAFRRWSNHTPSDVRRRASRSDSRRRK